VNINYSKLKKMSKQEKRDIMIRYRELDFENLPCPQCGDTDLEWGNACPSYFSGGQWWSCVNCGNAYDVRCFKCDWEYQETYNPDPDKYGIPPDYIELVFQAWYLSEIRDTDLWEYDDDGHHWEKPITRKTKVSNNLRRTYFVTDGEPDPYAEPEYAI
jgi:hypothetical protein